MSESDKNTTKHHIQESQEVSFFPAGDHKAAKHKQGNMGKTHTYTSVKEDPQKKSRIGMVSKNIARGLKLVSLYLLYVMFYCVFDTFPCGILGQVWCLNASITDPCLLSYFAMVE